MATQRLDLSTIKYNLANFRLHWLGELEEWAAAGLTGEEQKAAQRFWIDMMGCFGITAARMNLFELSLIHISEPTRLHKVSRMPSSA